MDSRIRASNIIWYMLVGAIILVSIMVMGSFDPPVNIAGKAVWMQQGETLNIFDGSIAHTVQLFDVAGSNNRTKLCGFLVDGDHIWIEEDQDNVMKGLRIYVRDVILVRDQLQDKDVCKVAFAGAIIKINRTLIEEEGNLSAALNESNTIDAEPLGDITTKIEVEPTGDMDKVEEIVIQEKPEQTSFFGRIIGWLRYFFLNPHTE